MCLKDYQNFTTYSFSRIYLSWKSSLACFLKIIYSVLEPRSCQYAGLFSVELYCFHSIYYENTNSKDTRWTARNLGCLTVACDIKCLKGNVLTLHLSIQSSGYVGFNIQGVVVVPCLYGFFSAKCVGIYVLFDKQFYNILILFSPYS